MRVTGNYFQSAFVNQVNDLSLRQQRLQNQVSTGQRISAPEDDPAAVQRTLDLQSDQSAVNQYSSNITSLQSLATSSFNAISAVKTVSDRAGEIATLADGTRSSADLQSYATEVTGLIKQAVQTMNSQQDGNYIFGGTQSGQPPFVMTTDANGNVTGVTYQGNTATTQAQIDSSTAVTVDVPGANTSGTGAHGVITDSRTGADFFNHLISLQNNLLAGNTNAISTTDTPALSNDENNLISQISNNGAIQTQLNTAQTANGKLSTSLTASVSSEADVDMTDTIVQLNQAQYAYQAALQSGAGVLQKSLLDYISLT
ncbi:MAG TPA: flagellar hook-associated protein FlgL [Verrucomicrobiae bacterium]|jgi:flagellar hook-associated protein 3 FlgL|nr:flagellar hook-associated protein FlgL [Verrucomicrobiae bacterium]